MKTLSQLIQPVDVDTFFAEHWRKKPLYLQGDASRAADWMGLPQFARAVWMAPFADRNLDITLGGKRQHTPLRAFEEARARWDEPPSLDELVAFLPGGETLIVDGMQRRESWCRELCMRLFQETGRHTVINAYLSDGGAPSGIGAHFDPQEVFVLQVAGTKRWPLSETQSDDPVSRESRAASEARAFEPVAIYDLSPGDVLFIPRGTWHEPETLEGPSLHLTVTLPALVPLDVLGWLHEQLVDDPVMREELHLEPDPGATERAVRAQLETALERIAALCRASDAATRFSQDTFLRHAARYANEKIPDDRPT